VPCIECNRKIKFRDLLDTARDLALAGVLATRPPCREPGAARSVAGLSTAPPMPTGTRAISSTRPPRTSSTFCAFRWATGPSETRAIARDLGLVVADKADSQDICFSCGKAAIPMSSSGCGRARRHRARSSIWTDACSAGMPA
jgi:tRNA-specific 2-thiouridylase